ncbi:hypothetical protein [Aeromicrobium sp. 9AM]|uniref:hypothetical protein n=1 Tax=Aeromicrobium sp. 9AM TaxID=2653126 RepID=UPI0012F3CC09|nr:hypothetical protein [Aeromicrobium sp. 9AM]VXB83353.1 hypothetical protein AERO9AM_21017 [Aeromicrobium sp. 9AM]
MTNLEKADQALAALTAADRKVADLARDLGIQIAVGLPVPPEDREAYGKARVAAKQAEDAYLAIVDELMAVAS